ncbi:MAG: DUF4445 domain-containing protein [Chloroflexi bacterium]|nr:DUF4445 domain-containing protein [Chloroflexota bacterium]
MQRQHIVTFIGTRTVNVPTGTLLTEAAALAGQEITQPCGGQGRCGRCAVFIKTGQVRHRSTQRLTAADVAAGYALACQAVIESNISVVVPEQEKVERRLTTDLTAAEVTLPPGYEPAQSQTLQYLRLDLPPPNMDDQTDDWSRVQLALRHHTGQQVFNAPLAVLRKLGPALREGDWRITILLETETWDRPADLATVLDILPGHLPEDTPIWGAAIDIGTTTVTVWLVDLHTGQVVAQAAEYNGQIVRGEDVISRIIYAGKSDGGAELKTLVLETVNALLHTVCKRASTTPDRVFKVALAGNSTMMHLLLQIPAESIRLSPFITGMNHPPTLTAHEVGLDIVPHATVDCLPGVASYVGADISAGVLATELYTTEPVTLFMDVGTNGETVLGNQDWLVTCACSAGPAFEGAGVLHGMRATNGAIEEVWIHHTTYEPTCRVIGGKAPRGFCGSGLISLLAEMFLTGLLDKSGNIKLDLPTSRVRTGLHGPEYVVAWGDETATGEDIVITHVDIDNLLRAKAAIYAGYAVLAESVGVSLDMVEQVMIGGAFGQYINVEKAVQIGLLPDLPWEQFHFLGNTSVRGAYHALIDRDARRHLKAIADRMTYIELSADNRFYEAFTSALFLPHTDLSRFPTVQAEMV